MGRWGRGLLQSDDDYDIASELGNMLGCDLMNFTEDNRDEIAHKLNENGLLGSKLEKLLSPAFRPRFEYHTRERMLLILGILAMELGAKISHEHMRMMRTLRPCLRNIHEQLQIVTALDEYKNDGTRGILGSKGLSDTVRSKETGKTAYDNGDEFWFSGLG